jgi:hypothetical protein
MSYLTSVERFGREEGKRESLLEGIASCQSIQFGAAGTPVLSATKSITDVDKLQDTLQAIETARGLEELRQLCT